MTVAGTSYWYYVRLGQWMWLVDRLLDAAIIEVLLVDARPGGLDVDRGVAPGIMAAARAAASHHGLAFRAAEGAQEAPSEILDANDQPAGGAQARPAARAGSAGLPAAAPAAVPPPPPPPRSIAARIRGRLARALGRPPTDEKARRRALVANRIARLATEP